MLTIIRGLPGSGKSTMALSLSGNPKHFEADMFFLNEKGEYIYDRDKQREAHEWCQNSVREALIAGHSVVVSNTFVRKWEMEPYIQMAIELHLPYAIMTATGNFKNIHNVPDEIIERMKANWEEIE